MSCQTGTFFHTYALRNMIQNKKKEAESQLINIGKKIIGLFFLDIMDYFKQKAHASVRLRLQVLLSQEILSPSPLFKYIKSTVR